MSTYWLPHAHVFTYNPQAGFVSELTRLASQMGWGRRSAQYRNERTLCFQLELLVAFGPGTDLEKWQKLCEEVEIEQIPTSITGCRKVRYMQWLMSGPFLMVLWLGFKSHLGEHRGLNGVSLIKYTSSPISIAACVTHIHPKEPKDKNFPKDSCERRWICQGALDNIVIKYLQCITMGWYYSRSDGPRSCIAIHGLDLKRNGELNTQLILRVLRHAQLTWRAFEPSRPNYRPELAYVYRVRVRVIVCLLSSSLVSHRQ